MISGYHVSSVATGARPHVAGYHVVDLAVIANVRCGRSAVSQAHSAATGRKHETSVPAETLRNCLTAVCYKRRPRASYSCGHKPLAAMPQRGLGLGLT